VIDLLDKKIAIEGLFTDEDMKLINDIKTLLSTE
jgi:hypothetical protein